VSGEPAGEAMAAFTLQFAGDINDTLRKQVSTLLHSWQVPEITGTARVARLAGGASNVNLKITCGQDSYALRVCMPDSARWGVDRAAAIQAQRDAAALGVAPGVLASDPAEGHVLAAFIDGAVLTPELLRREHLLPEVACTLRRLNAGTTRARQFSPFDDMRTFVELGSAEHAPVPAGLDAMLARVFRIEALFRNRPMRTAFCHSDLVPQNFLLTADGFRLVDWDYAGQGWVAFEMASFCCQAGLGPAETEEFLTAYDPQLDDGQRARVELMRLVAGVREAAWATMAEPILAEHTTPMPGWTYTGYAAANLEQADTVVATGFDRLLDAARTVRPGARF
jgi:thiamine kinase-like enzyme